MLPVSESMKQQKQQHQKQQNQSGDYDKDASRRLSEATRRNRRRQNQENETKNYFRNDFMPDSEIRPINRNLVEYILSFKPETVFEFGCGTCKNLILLHRLAEKSGLKKISSYGMDVNDRALDAAGQNSECKSKLIHGDEHTLHRLIEEDRLPKMDVVFTCGVLDHMLTVSPVISDLKRLTNKVLLCYETNSIVGRYYFGHNYGMEKLMKVRYFKYLSTKQSGGDGATYNLHIYKNPETMSVPIDKD